MKKLILILAIVALSTGSLFAQTMRTKTYSLKTISGIEVFDNASATVALTADSCRNIIHVNADADALEYDLPVAEDNLITGFLDDAGGAITLDPNGSEYIVVNGTSAGAGTAVVSDGTRGRYAVLLGRNGYWILLPTSGWE